MCVHFGEIRVFLWEMGKNYDFKSSELCMCGVCCSDRDGHTDKMIKLELDVLATADLLKYEVKLLSSFKAYVASSC